MTELVFILDRSGSMSGLEADTIGGFNSMLAQLDLSIEGMQPVLEMLPKSLQQLIGGYIQQLTGTPSFSPMIVGLGLTLYFLSRAVNDAHGQ